MIDARAVTRARVALAVANYVVAALNAAAAFDTGSTSDVAATVAWLGSGTFWLWQALEERHV